MIYLYIVEGVFMNRVKSRNIVLVVCGGFFFVIILFSIFLGILKIVDTMNEISIYDNVLLSSSILLSISALGKSILLITGIISKLFSIAKYTLAKVCASIP